MFEKPALLVSGLFSLGGAIRAYTSGEYLKNPTVTYIIKPRETITIDSNVHKEILNSQIEDASSAFDTGISLLVVAGVILLLTSIATRNQP